MSKLANTRWDMGSRDHEYVESITMYKGEDSSSDEEPEAPRHQLARATGVQSRRSRWRAAPEYRDQTRIQAPAAVSEGLGRLKARMRIGWG